MRHRHAAVVSACALGVLSGWLPALGQQPGYDSDPDPNRPTLHVQPPVPAASERLAGSKLPASVINGITYIDVFVAAGFDLSGGDIGNEPAVTADPLAPNRIVLTSFSGSNWGTGGNSTLFYSGDGGASWTYSVSIPPPPGATTNINCPCDQTVDWGRNGLLYGTFLFYGTGTQNFVYSAQAADPTNPASWVYRAPGGIAQTTNNAIYPQPDQPWLFSGPLPGDNSVTNVCVGYDVFDANYLNSETHAADSPGASPLDFNREMATNDDGVTLNGSMNPGNRIAVGANGKIFNVFQRLGSVQANGVKLLSYIVTLSSDGGLSWSVVNSDHASLGKIVAANVLSFQGNGSKIGGVNALLGGVDAVAADPTGSVAWVVYGKRLTASAHDQLFLVKVTENGGSLTIGTPLTLTPSTLDSYLPSVAVLPNGEVGILYLTLSGSAFQWLFDQYTNGTTLAKSTAFPSFTSPFSSTSATNQRIFGDFVQVRPVGCAFYGAYPARGSGPNSVNSIDPYFFSAPSSGTCALPTLSSLDPSAACAGGPGLDVAIHGTGFTSGATGRVLGALRPTTFNSGSQVTAAVAAADIAAPGTVSIDLLGAVPAGVLTNSLPFAVELPPASPGSSLRVDPGGANVDLSWTASSGATSYRIRRCVSTLGACTPVPVSTSPTASYQDGVRLDSDSYWYQIDAVNSCGPAP